MYISNNSNTNFQAKIILAEKNNSLIKKAIKASFNHEQVEHNLDKIYKYQPKTTLLVEMERLSEPQYGDTHKIIITNQNNAQTITTKWGENGVSAWSFGDIIEKMTNLKDNIVNKFWNAPAIQKEKKFNILQHKIFADEYDFNYEKHIKECEQEDTIEKLSTKIENTKTGLDDIIREYKYDKHTHLKQEQTKSSPNYSFPSMKDYDEHIWNEIRKMKELRKNLPPSKEEETNRAIWAATMWRNCNK